MTYDPTLDALEAKTRAALDQPSIDTLETFLEADDPATILALIADLRAERRRADRMRQALVHHLRGAAREISAVMEHDADRDRRLRARP